jgi:uncharacterized membrane protein YdjX (TVP38/TMEM64 family)
VQNKDDFKQWISTFGAYDEIVFVSVRALQTVVKIIPAEPLEIGAGYVWGTYKGFALCLLGTEIGSLIILVLTSIFGVKLINLFFDVETINKWSFIANSRKKYTVLTIIYLIPGTPKDFLTYFIGVTDTNFWLFLLVTSIARIPSIISSTWCGSILQTSGIKQFVIIFALITLVSLIAGYFAKDIYNKKSKVNA